MEQSGQVSKILYTLLVKKTGGTTNVQVRRGHGTSTPGDLAKSAAAAMDAGADTVAICSDAEATPQGLVDLFTVCRAIKQPVVARDWYLHPIQVFKLHWSATMNTNLRSKLILQERHRCF